MTEKKILTGTAKEAASPEKKGLSEKTKKALMIGAPLAALLAVYLCGCLFFSQAFLPNTTLNGEPAGGKTMAAAAEIPRALSENNLFTVETMGEPEQFHLSDIDYLCQYAGDLSALMEEQSPYAWPAAFFQERAYDVPVDVTYDEEKLTEQLRQLNCFTDESIQAPVNAYISQEGDDFEIVKPVDGNTLDLGTSVYMTEQALEAGHFSVDLEETGCYLKAYIREDDPELVAQMENVEKYKDLEIVIDLTDATETLSYEQFKDWLTTDGTTISLLEEPIKDYVTGLSQTYNTFNSQRSFTTTGGSVIQVGGSGVDTYGFQMNISKTQERIKEALDAMEPTTISAAWKIPASCRNAANGDIGSTYVEASIGAQHMWYYKDGVLQCEANMVSGLAGTGRATPRGVFRIWGKQRDRILRGDDYESFVSYWMPFTWTGCGLHDAPWRSAFGGSIYKTNGSHGCLNLPPASAAILYNLVAYDTPVIVY